MVDYDVPVDLGQLLFEFLSKGAAAFINEGGWVPLDLAAGEVAIHDFGRRDICDLVTQDRFTRYRFELSQYVENASEADLDRTLIRVTFGFAKSYAFMLADFHVGEVLTTARDFPDEIFICGVSSSLCGVQNHGAKLGDQTFFCLISKLSARRVDTDFLARLNTQKMVDLEIPIIKIAGVHRYLTRGFFGVLPPEVIQEIVDVNGKVVKTWAGASVEDNVPSPVSRSGEDEATSPCDESRPCKRRKVPCPAKSSGSNSPLNPVPRQASSLHEEVEVESRDVQHDQRSSSLTKAPSRKEDIIISKMIRRRDGTSVETTITVFR